MNIKEQIRKTAVSVQTKLVYKFTRRMDDTPANEFGHKPMATYPWLKEQCSKNSPSTAHAFEEGFKQALKQQVIWDINGLYTTKRPDPRTLDDEWDY